MKCMKGCVSRELLSFEESVTNADRGSNQKEREKEFKNELVMPLQPPLKYVPP